MDKVLTVVIPTYNMERYLRYCLDSLCVSRGGDVLEVLVINDGSKDSSSAIAHEYEREYPGLFRVIDKENGNYGSCINRGLAEAKGKYIKILDADDSFDTKNFECFIDFLCMTDSELVVSDFSIVDEDRNIKKVVCHGFPAGYVHIDEICTAENFSHIQMHAVTYRKNVLLNLSYKQTEGISYTDQEWVFIPMVGVKSVCYFDKSVYMYLVGRVGQTMNPDVKAKHITHVCKCTYSMLNVYMHYRNRISEQLITYLNGRLDYMIREVYVFYLQHYSARNKNALIQFDSTLKGISQEVYYRIGNENSKFNYIHLWRNNINLSPAFIRLAGWLGFQIVVPLKRFCLFYFKRK